MLFASTQQEVAFSSQRGPYWSPLMRSTLPVQTIDLHFQGTPGIISAYVLRSGDEVALIETGPGSCNHMLVEGLGKIGILPSDVGHVFLTHIHLDHAGGAGWWAQAGAQVYVHGKGAAHIVDPSKLIESATRIYGDKMDSLWGPILPAPASKVTVLGDGDKVTVGTQTIEALDTPGHARHHLAYALGDVCFTGDVAGICMPGCDYLSVAAAPPQFEPDPYVVSLDRLLARRFSRLYLAHFGAIEDPQSHLTQYRQRILDVYSTTAQWMRDGITGTALAQCYSARERAVAALSDDEWNRYELANGTVMCASGIELYVTKSTP